MRREKNEVSHHIAIHIRSLLCTHRMVLWQHVCPRRNHITTSESVYRKKKYSKEEKEKSKKIAATVDIHWYIQYSQAFRF